MSVVAAMFVLLLAVRLSGLERGRLLVAAITLTPYGVPIGLVAIGIAVLVHERLAAALLAACTAVTASLIARRLRRRPVPEGDGFRVMTVNLLRGNADPDAVVALVRTFQPDVLCLQECTADGARRLKGAGLFELLPHVDFDQVGPGLRGLGLASATATVPLASGPFSVGAIVRGVEVHCVHPVYPMGLAGPRPWHRSLAELPAAPAEGRIRVLAGDFNASLDHGPFRRLLRTGYRDAAADTGRGLTPTWPGAVGPWAPPVVLDHVLVDLRAGVRSCAVKVVPGTDHRAVLSEIVVPWA